VLTNGLDDRGFQSRQRLGNFFTTVSRQALGPNQPPIQWAPGVLSLGVKRPGREADHSPPSSAEVKQRNNFTLLLLENIKKVFEMKFEDIT
jgi:hypothetical protein